MLRSVNRTDWHREGLMLFNSIAFLFFFPFTVLLYFVIPKRFQYIWLLIVSYGFYLSQGGAAVVFLLYSTVLTWITGDIIYKSKKRVKRITLFISLLLNLLPLLVFKYSNFFLELIKNEKSFNLLLPAGISFYTLQSMTYVIDCYRDKLEPEKNLFRYALFVSFFPCILSGPIERAGNMLPQINAREHGFDPIRVKEGLFTMLWGYFIKLVIVSRLEILTDLVYTKYAVLSGTAVLIGVIAYSIQIYCDFAGYSFIALGAARILGYNIICNFKQPYLATSIQDFWRRWHISLSTWFRDYLYIPLGGNRKGKMRQYFNLLIVFTVSGLWHGANLTFIVWGLLYGIYQVLGNMVKPVREKAEAFLAGWGDGSVIKMYQALRIIITYVIITLTWIPFRSTTLSQAVNVLRGIFRDNRLSYLFDGTVAELGLGVNNLLFVIASIIIVAVVDMLCERKGCEIYHLFDNTRASFRWCFYYIVIVCILFSANLSTQEFLYQSF